MANRERVNNILKNAEKLKLRVLRPRHIELVIPQAFEFRVFINLFGEEIEGIGTGLDEDLAFLKAFSEAVERSFCTKLRISSSGIAAHYDYDDACENAMAELVERDAFLTKYLLGLPGERIDEHKMFEVIKNKAEVEIFNIGSTTRFDTFLSVGKLPNAGVVIGLGSSTDRDSAIKKSLFECVSRLSYFLKCGTEKLPQDGNNLFNNVLGGKFLKSHFYNKSQGITNLVLQKSIRNDAFKYEIIGYLNEIISALDLVVVKATNPELQSMYKGEKREDVINWNRLREISGKDVNFDELEKELHPVG